MKLAYTAFDMGGKSASATIDANSISDAKEQLRKRGLFVTTIAPADGNGAAGASSGGGGGSFRRMGAGARLRNLAVFTRQLCVLLASGTPIVQAMTALERQCEGATWKSVIVRLRERVEEGTPLSEAMRQQSHYFDAVCRSLVAAGEASGNLSAMLERLAQLTRKQLQLRNSILGALVYPSLLMSLGFCVLIVMLMFVVPRFALLFENLDSPLPPTTKLLLFLSGLLWSYWWLFLILIVGGVIAARLYITSAAGRHAFHTALLKLPKIGKISRSLMTARVSRMLGTLLESKVALLDALALTKQSAVNLHYADLVQRAEDAVGKGEPISSVISNSDLISPCVQEAVRNGEQSGQIGQPLLQMAEFLDEENEVVVKSLTSLIEPMILIALGLIVGVIAMSMFLPLFDLVAAAGGGG